MALNDDLDIRSGGLIAVDTGTLRHVAGLLTAAAAQCDDLADALRAAGRASAAAGLLEPAPAGHAVDAADRARGLARALRERAEAYELVERHASGRLAEWGTGAAAVRAERLWTAWEADRHREVERQLAGAVLPVVPLALAVSVALSTIRQHGRGTLAADDPRLSGTPVPTSVTPLHRAEVAAPRTLEDLAARMPGEGESRVRVETYETPNGREHVVYIAGTQDLGRPYDDPWDMASNLELYSGASSSSYDAVLRALVEAGVTSSEPVHLVGHSQGGMIAVRLAREAAIEVATLVTFATPVEAHVGEEVLAVTVRHPDDPVVALTVGGVPTAAGSRDSFVVERVVDPEPALGDFAFGAHQMDAYRETAARVDASDDPRVDALRLQLAGLGMAAGTAVVYGARREFISATPRRRPVSGASAAGAG